MIADTLRATVGSENVTHLEELVANVEDRTRLLVGNGSVRGLADAIPEEAAALPGQPLPAVSSTGATAFHPRDVKPMFANVASPDDGRWQAVAVAGASAPVIYRTILHPDAQRSYAELFVFALDLKSVQVHAAAGSVEPKSVALKNGVVKDAGLVRDEHAAQVVAAFNGGFKAEHGQYGMMVDGVELLAPKSTSCTVAGGGSDSLRIGTWANLESAKGSFGWWRQTPPCMVENGELHAGLRSDKSTSWGATIEGSTVIRRSAIGVDASGSTLFVAISNATTARALATGMQHAGAHQVAQLDINYSYPKFLLYRADGASNERSAMTAVKGFLYDKDDYVRRASTRDFFYVTLR
jgi:hypothetical protein